MSFISSVLIMKGSSSRMAPMVPVKPKEGSFLSVMQFKKGIQCREPTYLTALLEDDPDTSKQNLPKPIEHVLFKDFMSKTLLQKLPPRRKVDHQIK